jgi:hypothetical protein
VLKTERGLKGGKSARKLFTLREIRA